MVDAKSGQDVGRWRRTGGKPFLSSVCRQIGVRPPDFWAINRATPTVDGQQALATIRGILLNVTHIALNRGYR
ncbi:hypothetical protein CA601_25495 [Paraburkholderia hospita]|nr:hypothetical protein CA601_25495 [Paraburkholderia hospita]